MRISRKTKFGIIIFGFILSVGTGLVWGFLAQREYRKLETSTPIEGKIVFNSNLNGQSAWIYLLEQGKLEKLVGGLNPKFSQDGTKIIYWHKGWMEIYDLTTKTTHLTRIPSEEPIEGVTPSTLNYDWSPDGKTIVFAGYEPHPEDKRWHIDNIYTIDIDGKKLRKITPFIDSYNSRAGWPRFSPDGRKIVFEGPKNLKNLASGGTIYVIDVDGENLSDLLPEKIGGIEPAWSPDGSRIVFTRFGGDDDAEVYTIRLDGSELRKITDNEWNDRYPVFSPDGKQICFVSFRHNKVGSAGFGSELYVINTDGTGEARVTPAKQIRHKGWADVHNPDWAP